MKHSEETLSKCDPYKCVRSFEERSTVFGIPNVEYRISFLSSNWMSATQSTNTLTKQLTVHESQSLYWKPSDLD